MMTVERDTMVGNGPSRIKRWGVTLAATAASFTLLDLFATAGGIVLASSGILQSQGQSMVTVLLIVSYALWVIGLRVNLAANAQLLTSTGTSTNVFSKFLFDRASSRGAGDRVRKLAASTGYVGMQVACELPYYLSAFGAAAATELIDSTDAMIFLAGTNVAAGIYEYGIARATRGYVERRDHQLAEPAVVPW